MSQQAINTNFDSSRRNLGDLVVGIRVDALPQGEAERLAAAGQFYPLTVDERGCLRVAIPEGSKVDTEELEVLREIRDLLAEHRDLLLKIA